MAPSPQSFLAAMLLAALLAMCTQMHTGALALSCSTNSGSPTQADANTCVQYIRNLGSTTCCQQGASGGCTTMHTVGTAAVDICGNNGCTTCTNAGNALNTILSSCVANINGARVAGSTSVSGFTVRIRHS